LFHSHGSNFADRKNLPNEVCREFYRRYLDDSDGSLVLLDWDLRIPTLRHQRVRHVKRDFGHISLEHLGALYAKADLLIGVDSGPYHFAKLFRVPTAGVWRQHIPSQCTLPNSNAVNLVRREPDNPAKWASRRSFWNLVEYDGPEVTAEHLMNVARSLLGAGTAGAVRWPLGVGRTAARNAYFRGLLGRSTTSGGTELRDRHRTLGWLFEEASRRFESPVIVETGCIRATEDWSAGYFTYLASAYLEARGGSGVLHSVDVDSSRLAFAKQTVARFKADVRFHHARSETWLSSGDASATIDVLYLDSLDVEDPRHAEHCLSEFLAAESRLTERSIVAIDDTTWDGGLAGKGRLAVPEMLRRGWRVRASGYQTMLTRD
jgi:hypothetical protein